MQHTQAAPPPPAPGAEAGTVLPAADGSERVDWRRPVTLDRRLPELSAETVGDTKARCRVLTDAMPQMVWSSRPAMRTPPASPAKGAGSALRHDHGRA